MQKYEQRAVLALILAELYEFDEVPGWIVEHHPSRGRSISISDMTSR